MIIEAKPGWTVSVSDPLPGGSYIAVIANENADMVGIQGRSVELELKDTLTLFRAGPKTSLVLLFRKPATEWTVTEQVLTTGTNAMNVDGCRVNVNHGGRWPTNLLLVHGTECQRIGETRIEGHKGYPNGPGGSSSQFSQKGTPTTRKASWKSPTVDSDGMETIQLWNCQSDCPVRILDQQSGELTSGYLSPTKTGFTRSPITTSSPTGTYGDTGGASRFFPQFASDTEMLGWVKRLISPQV